MPTEPLRLDGGGMKTLILIAVLSTVFTAAGVEFFSLSFTARLLAYGAEAGAQICCICVARYATVQALRRALDETDEG